MLLLDISHFDGVKVEEKNGNTIIILNVKREDIFEEFSQELTFSSNEKRGTIKESAINFVKNKFPKIRKATIIITVGAAILASFPLNKTEAHEVSFNMTYLYFGNTQSYISQIDKTHGNLSLVSPSYFDINTDGSLKITTQFDPTFVNEMHNRGIKVVPFLSNHWDRNLGRAALANRETLTSQIADFIIKNNLDGVQVDIENVTDIDRDSYTDLVRLLRQKIPSEKEVSVAVAANPNGWTKGWHGSYDYKELAKYSSYLMVMAYDESYTGGPEGPVASYGWVEKSIQYTLNQGVPAEKVVLGIPFYGRYWKEGEATGGTGISNVKVDEMLKKYGGTVIFDEITKSPKATITIKEGDPVTIIAGKTLTLGTYHIWYENHESIKAKLQLVHKYNLKGTGSWSLGQESTSIWQNYKAWLSHDGGVDVAPLNPEQPKEQTGSFTPTDTYIVKSGDSLWKIALDHKTTVDKIKELNQLKSDVIYVGQVLKIAQTIPIVQQPVVNEPAASTPGAISAPAQEAVLPPPKKSPTVTPIPKTAPKPPIKTSPVTQSKKYTTLRAGMNGSLVIDLQNKLKTVGIYKGRIHGTYDNATKNAVVAFQKKYKLTQDGIAGPLTLSKMDSVKK